MAKLAYRTEEIVQGAAESVGLGKVGQNAHPTHPAVVHFPVALLTFSFLLDNLSLVRDLVPRSLDRMLPRPAQLDVVSHYSLAAGLFFSVPAVLTGLAELWAMWRENKKLEEAIDVPKEIVEMKQEKFRQALKHAATNNFAVVIAMFNWVTRRKHSHFSPNGLNLLLSALALPVLVIGAYLGGDLVYRLGVGTQRQGSAVEVRKVQEKHHMR